MTKKIIAGGIFIMLIMGLMLMGGYRMETDKEVLNKTTRELITDDPGTSGNPYVIYDVNDLQNMSLDLSGYYTLANDIDASETEYWNEGAGFVPIGDSSNRFTGSLNGGNYSIEFLHINRLDTSNIGFFGSSGDGVEVSNLYMNNTNISGRFYVGGLVGHNIFVDSAVERSYATGGVVASNGYGGGLVGWNDTRSICIG